MLRRLYHDQSASFALTPANLGWAHPNLAAMNHICRWYMLADVSAGSLDIVLGEVDR